MNRCNTNTIDLMAYDSNLNLGFYNKEKNYKVDFLDNLQVYNGDFRGDLQTFPRAEQRRTNAPCHVVQIRCPKERISHNFYLKIDKDVPVFCECVMRDKIFPDTQVLVSKEKHSFVKNYGKLLSTCIYEAEIPSYPLSPSSSTSTARRQLNQLPVS